MGDSTGKRHTWTFFRAGGLTQVLIRNGEDIARLPELDLKLWAILSMPIRGVRFDARTLELMDTDRDGRIRVPELLAAIRWTVALLKNPDDLLLDRPDLPLDAIRDDTPDGARIKAGAQRILLNLGKATADRITLADVADRAAIFAQTRFNGDGIVPPYAADEDETRTAIEQILSCMGGETDRSGKPGVTRSIVETFFREAQAYAEWWSRAEKDPTILPLGAKTAAAAAAVRALREKVEDYFTRCQLAAFDSAAHQALNPSEADFSALAHDSLSLSHEAMRRLPLASIEAEKPLPLSGRVNPAWADALVRLRDLAVVPLLGTEGETLSEMEWRQLNARLSPFEQWQTEKQGQAVERLGMDRIRALLNGPARERILTLIEKDLELAVENAQIEAVEKLIRYQANLNRLIHNFVNLSDFYDPRRDEIFRTGRLYLDGRSCDLCLPVDDIARHSAMAASSRIFLAYCDLTQATSGQKRTICAAVTAGFAETIWVGRNGIFFDREGRDWEAKIVKVVESPISLKEAFWYPWKKIAEMIGDQINRLLSQKQETMIRTTAAAVETMALPGAPAPGSPPAAKPSPPRLEGAALASSVAALGIAVGLVGSAVGGLVSVISGLPLWKILLGILGVILAVSGPSVILTYFRLRGRDLAPILNASGWAVNGRIRMTMKLSQEFTREAVLPPGARRRLTDPYADRRLGRNLALVAIGLLIAIVILWRLGWYNTLLPAFLKVIRTPPPVAVP